MMMTEDTMLTRPSIVGQSVKRREDPHLLTGLGRFVDDEHVPGTTYLAFVRSTHAHACIVGFKVPDTLPPGVLLILTAEQITTEINPLPVLWQFPGLRNTANPPLATGKVRFVGESIALVVAEDRYLAEDAIGLVQVAYEPLPAVVDAEQALQPGAPLLYEEWQTNVPCPALTVPMYPLENRDIEHAFARADRVIRIPRLASGRVTAVPMETRGCLATYDGSDETLTLQSSTQVNLS